MADRVIEHPATRAARVEAQWEDAIDALLSMIEATSADAGSTLALVAARHRAVKFLEKMGVKVP